MFTLSTFHIYTKMVVRKIFRWINIFFITKIRLLYALMGIIKDLVYLHILVIQPIFYTFFIIILSNYWKKVDNIPMSLNFEKQPLLFANRRISQSAYDIYIHIKRLLINYSETHIPIYKYYFTNAYAGMLTFFSVKTKKLSRLFNKNFQAFILY